MHNIAYYPGVHTVRIWPQGIVVYKYFERQMHRTVRQGKPDWLVEERKFMRTIIAQFRKRKQLWTVPLYGIFYLICFRILENVIRVPGTYHLINSPLDREIPFCEYFVIFYYSWFVYVAVAEIYFCLVDRDVTEFNQFIFYLGTGMTIFLIFSAIYPNGLNIRPHEFARDNIFVRMCQALYRTDTPTNVFPSLHVFNSVAIFLAACDCNKLKKHKGLLVFLGVWSLLIILSTMFIKQHSCYDVLAGIVMGVILYYLYYVFIPDRIKARAASSVEVEI